MPSPRERIDGLKHAAPRCADLLGLQTRRGPNHSAAHVGASNSRQLVFGICRASITVSAVESSLVRVPQAAD